MRPTSLMTPNKAPRWIWGIERSMKMTAATLRWNGLQNRRGCILRAGRLMLVIFNLILTRPSMIIPEEGLVPLLRRMQHAGLLILSRIGPQRVQRKVAI
jgi:hypothetical protein